MLSGSKTLVPVLLALLGLGLPWSCREVPPTPPETGIEGEGEGEANPPVEAEGEGEGEPAPPENPEGEVACTGDCSYRVVNTYPHDENAFTQGLIFADGFLYEGTGLRGRSSLRRVALETGAVLQRVDLAREYFGEGITLFGNEIVQLTWQSNLGFVYDKDSFALIGDFPVPTEGWGITHDGVRLIMSDGSADLRFLDPYTLEFTGSVAVYDAQGPVELLNELEYIDGLVYANVWKTDRIARIAPETGEVMGWIDLTGLLPAQDRTWKTDVLNGIAYDAAQDRLFVTGKLWPKLFEIALVPVD